VSEAAEDLGRRYVVPYAPRDCYKPFHYANARYTQLVAHRRSGKTYAMLAEGIKRALNGQAGALYHYVAPYYGQAKAIAWDILSHLTNELGSRRSEVELWVDLPNRARIRLFGADRPDAMRGLRCHGLMGDEYADWADTVYQEIHQPMLADTRGWAIFSGTPKGRNHFFDQREMALADDKWHTELLPVSVTRLIPEEELAYIRTQMSPEVYAQEFECSFVAPRSGSYWGELVEKARASGRITKVPYDPSMPVEIATDLGFTDSTAVWYWQTGPDGYYVIDYDEFDSRPLDWWIRLWEAKGYEYSTIWLPHDARAKSFQTGKSTIEQMLSRDLPVKICPELSKQHGIEAVRLEFARWHFDEQQCRQGLNRLSNYSRAWNAKNKCFADHPKHDENSHGADAARYMALVQQKRPSQFRDDKPKIGGMNKRYQLEVLFNDRESYTNRGGAAGMG
jgi:hypothetical protein